MLIEPNLDKSPVLKSIDLSTSLVWIDVLALLIPSSWQFRSHVKGSTNACRLIIFLRFLRTSFTFQKLINVRLHPFRGRIVPFGPEWLGFPYAVVNHRENGQQTETFHHGICRPIPPSMDAQKIDLRCLSILCEGNLRVQWVSWQNYGRSAGFQSVFVARIGFKIQRSNLASTHK